MTHAVATLTAPSTPIASCTRCGMNVRVETVPPCRGDRYQAHLRHGLARHVAEIHAWPELQTDLLDAHLQRRVRFELLRRLVARDAEIVRPHHDDRHAVVDAGHLDAIDGVDDANRSAATRRSSNRRRPGTRAESRRQCPARRRCAHRLRIRPGRPASARRLRRCCRYSPCGCVPASSRPPRFTSPFSIAHGPTPASMLPQFWLSLTSALSTTTCRNR